MLDRVQQLRKKLIAREKIIGMNLCYAHEENVRAIDVPELDFLMFDFEHGAYNLEQCISLMRLCRERGLPTLVRVQDSVYNYIAKPVDFGAEGVMLPRVETMAQIEIGLQSMWYPPYGKKGFVGTAMRPGEQFEEIAPSRILLPQIESPMGNDILPEIFECYGDRIHGAIIGPYDLSIAVGTPLEINSAAALREIERTMRICDRYGKSCGIYCDDADVAKHWFSEGMNILWTANEMFFMQQGYVNALKTMLDA